MLFAAAPTFAGVSIENQVIGITGVQPNITGSGYGLAVTYLPYRLEYNSFSFENKGVDNKDDRSELTINNFFVGYRWTAYKASIFRLHIDTGANIISRTGTSASLKNPAIKNWSDPHIGVKDIVEKRVDETMVGVGIGPAIQWVFDDVIVIGIFGRGYLQEKDPFICGGISFGLELN